MRAIPARLFFAVFLAFFGVSCAGKPPVEIQPVPGELPRPGEPEGPPEPGELPEPDLAGDFPAPAVPAGLVFIPARPPPLVPAPGVGVINRLASMTLSAEDRAVLRDSFRAAYLDGLLRDLPLAGVLGGDQVHLWPDANPSAWVQNWRGARPAPNSWGIPSLILAIRGIETAGEMNRVFIVDGEILDYYGTSAGRNGANGGIGYGSPRGEKFFYNGGIAQRFDHGLIVIDGEGRGRFVPEDHHPPSLDREPPPELGVFPEAPGNGKVREAFITAWKTALDRAIEGAIEMVPDGPGQYLSGFPYDPDSSPSGEPEGLYVQTFNNRGALIILPNVSGVPPLPPLHARVLLPPFLGAFISPGGDDFARQLMGGVARYGFPLTDPLPYRAGEDLPWQEAQRFSGGWLVSNRNP